MKTDTVKQRGGFHPDYSEEIQYFRENRVYTVQIESTLACRQGCLYCYASTGNPPNKEMFNKDVISILDSASEMGVRAIDWLGGDPLLKRGWYGLMRYAMRKKLRNNIWTSGIPLADKRVAKKVFDISKGGFVSVHLDTLDRDIYHRLHKGVAEKKMKAILRGVDNLQSCGKDPGEMINCITLTKLVAQDAIRTMEFFYKDKGMRTCLTQMCRVGQAKDRLDWVPTCGQAKTAYDARDRINYPGARYSMCSMDTNKFYCGGMICVTIDGDVTPCSVIRKSYGNIRETPLKNIIETHKNELLCLPLRDPSWVQAHGKCGTCKHNPVCWGCRAAAFYEHGDLFGPDPNCYISQL